METLRILMKDPGMAIFLIILGICAIGCIIGIFYSILRNDPERPF